MRSPGGAEDAEELVQDSIVTAAQMLDAVERNGKTVTPGNIAYYTILHMKSGRRSKCRSRAEATACVADWMRRHPETHLTTPHSQAREERGRKTGRA